MFKFLHKYKWYRLRQPLTNKPQYLTKDMLKRALIWWSNVSDDNNFCTGLCLWFDRHEQLNGVNGRYFGRFLYNNHYLKDIDIYIASPGKSQPRVELLEELIKRWDN